MGVGLPLARLHARQLGGGLQLGSLPGVGVTAVLRFDVSGGEGDGDGDGGDDGDDEEEADERFVVAAPAPFRPLALRQLHSFGQQPQPQARTTAAAAASAASAAAKSGGAFLAASTAEALRSLAPAATAVATAAPTSAAAAALAKACAEAEPKAGASATAKVEAKEAAPGAIAIDAALSSLETAAERLRSPEERTQLLPTVPLAQLAALAEGAAARALTLRLMRSQLRRAAGGGEAAAAGGEASAAAAASAAADGEAAAAVTAHVRDVAALARDAAEEAQSILLLSHSGRSTPPPSDPAAAAADISAVAVEVSGHGGCLTAPALLREALVALIGDALHNTAAAPRDGGRGGDLDAKADDVVTVEVSADAAQLGVRVVSQSRPSKLQPDAAAAAALVGPGAPFDRWAARLRTRQLGGDVRWVATPGRHVEAFLTVARDGG